MYLNHSLVGMGVEALHLGELALEVGGAVTAAAYLSSAVRHGATPVALVYGGVLGEEGALAVAGHKLGKASPWLLTVPAGFALAATYDAATANVGCR